MSRNGPQSAPAFDLEARLAEVSLDTALQPEARAALARRARLATAAEGERVEAADDGGLLLLLAGRLAMRRADDGRRLALLAPGAILAPLCALEGEAELVASEPCELARISPQDIDELTRLDAAGLAQLALRVAISERALQVAVHLSRLFPGLDGEALEAFGAGVEWVSLRGGEWLFRQDDPADTAYLVISGRVRAVARSEGGERLLNEVGAGETVGEMALLTDDVRSAGIYAVRDSQLVGLSRPVFDRLTEQHPAALRRISGFVVERLRRQNEGHRPSGSLAVFTLVSSATGRDVGALAERLASALAQAGSVEVIDRRRVESALGRGGIADAQDEHGAGIRLVRWLNDRDGGSRYLLYVCDDRFSPWTQRALRQADHVLVVARAEDGPAPGDLEQRLDGLFGEGRAPQRSLVLLHPEGARPAGTARWLAARNVDRHYHLREGNDEDLARTARLLTGHAVGLVLGGGGARGFAHLGALRALEETGVPVDHLGGTSIGAVIGALAALGMSASEARAQCRHSFHQLFDLTLPLVSLLAGRRIARNLEAVFSGIAIEDLVVPYFCVATNLSRAEAVVHRRGSLYRAVRSSISLPGVLPPVSIDGDLYVDGGLLDNLPIDVMASCCGGGPVVASDVSPDTDLRVEREIESALSGWRVLWARLNPFSRPLGIPPSIPSLLMRSAVVGSLVRDRERRAGTMHGLYLKMPVGGFGLLEFEKVEPIATRGYEASLEPVRSWWAVQKRAGLER